MLLYRCHLSFVILDIPSTFHLEFNATHKFWRKHILAILITSISSLKSKNTERINPVPRYLYLVTELKSHWDLSLHCLRFTCFFSLSLTIRSPNKCVCCVWFICKRARTFDYEWKDGPITTFIRCIHENPFRRIGHWKLISLLYGHILADLFVGAFMSGERCDGHCNAYCNTRCSPRGYRRVSELIF